MHFVVIQLATSHHHVVGNCKTPYVIGRYYNQQSEYYEHIRSFASSRPLHRMQMRNCIIRGNKQSPATLVKTEALPIRSKLSIHFHFHSLV